MAHLTGMSLTDAAAEIREEFSWLEDWEARYAHIIDLGKANPPLDAHERTEETRVRGCASQVWLVTGWDDGHLVLRAESDAMIVSGLIALLGRLYNGATRDEILAFDAKAFLDEIGVSGALTSQRTNGLASMLARIQADAKALPAS
ncbi:MAG: SufE family protein [Hyphomonas sp.]|uniref:SufE family protein n=1 Tax=Hyphomonas sp. TaxID=87 RepID=UPI003527BE6B